MDTNVLLDLSGRSEWRDWSNDALAEAEDAGSLVINPMVFAELAAGYLRIEELEAALPVDLFRREQLPWDAAYAAGIAFLSYRRRGGSRTAPLADFFIGAHAAVRGYRLLTRDRGYYATYFPTLTIISPEGSP